MKYNFAGTARQLGYHIIITISTMTNTTVGTLSFDSNISKAIGRVSYGVVFRGYIMSEAGQMKKVAVKQIQRGLVDETAIKQEVKNMQEAGDHPNILSFIHTETNDFFV